jgi:NAD(P)-dependent dehydrogenase (short-subunit alcohol dehydrogenase family)
MELGLRGRTAIVTGASMGIGLAIARALAAEGVDLTIAARSADLLHQHARTLADAHGVAVHPYPADLANADAVAELAAFAVERLGQADILVNNAGAIPGGPIDVLDDEAWHRAYDLKLWGYLRLSKALLPGMKARGSGVIINIIGNAGKRPSAGYIAGGIANAGLMNFTAGLAQDAGPYGVRVVAINPGLTRTERMEQLLQRQAIDRGVALDELRANAARDIPLRRVAEAQDVANLAVFLASDRAAMISGCTIPVEGGATASL